MPPWGITSFLPLSLQTGAFGGERDRKIGPDDPRSAPASAHVEDHADAPAASARIAPAAEPILPFDLTAFSFGEDSRTGDDQIVAVEPPSSH